MYDVREVQLKPLGSNDFLLDVEGQLIRPAVTLIAAGWRTLSLLNQVEIDPPLQVYLSPLLDLTQPPGTFEVPLLADCSSGLTIVRYDVPAQSAHHRLIIANGHRRPIRTSAREVTPEDIATISSLLPDLIDKAPARWVAGFKTESPGGGVAPWVHAYAERPGLIAGVPGKATNVLGAADESFRLFEELLGSEPRDYGAQPLNTSQLQKWEAPIHVHAHPCYDHINEDVRMKK
jgi:hypothetical protein